MSGDLKIGDTVYSLYDCSFGDLPKLHKGRITAIHKDGFCQVGPGHMTEQDRCYKDIHDLLNALKEHINNETMRIDNCVYDW